MNGPIFLNTFSNIQIPRRKQCNLIRTLFLWSSVVVYLPWDVLVVECQFYVRQYMLYFLNLSNEITKVEQLVKKTYVLCDCENVLYHVSYISFRHFNQLDNSWHLIWVKQAKTVYYLHCFIISHFILERTLCILTKPRQLVDREPFRKL